MAPMGEKAVNLTLREEKYIDDRGKDWYMKKDWQAKKEKFRGDHGDVNMEEVMDMLIWLYEIDKTMIPKVSCNRGSVIVKKN